MSSGLLLYCHYCEYEVNFDKKYLECENEIYEYIVCGICGELIASSAVHDDVEHKENYPIAAASTSYNQCDQDASGDRNENVIDISDVSCEIDLTDDDRDTGCIESLSLSPNHRRRLKNSISAFDFEGKQDVEVASPPLATLDNAELSRDSLKHARELHCRSLSCGSCTGLDSQILPVEGVKDIFYCSGCLEIHGVDDSMNYYDLLQKGDYAVEACVKCGNSDPYLFLVEDGSDSDSISLRCLKCSGDWNGNEECAGDVESVADENALERCLKEWIHYECKCKNTDSDLQRVVFDPNSNTVFMKCMVCEREDVITLSFKPKTCTCENAEFTDVKYDEYGYASQLVCLQCHAEMDCGVPSTSDVAAAGDGMSTGRTRIFSVGDIQIGDHIAWHQLLGYWHHAIVTDVDGAQIRVVHYNGPSLPNKGKVAEEWMPPDVTSELYRINYKPLDCSHPKVVVERARSRLGECQYNLLMNNCEHFARWCKTGHKRSLQSESFLRSLTKRAITLVESSLVTGSKWLLSSPQGNAALKYGAKFVGYAASADTVKIASEQALTKEVAPLVAAGTFAVPALIICREIQMVCGDILDAHRQRCAGNITRKEFVKITIKRTAEGCGSIAGVGVALAIPVARNSFGCTLGALIGQGVGSIVGRGICGSYGRRSAD